MRALSGQIALITGAGSGLGKAAALAFADEGAKVVLCGRRTAKLEEVSDAIAAGGGEALTVQADVSLESDVLRLVQAAQSRFGRIDIVVNNAAVFESGEIADTPLDAWNAQLSTNLTGPFLVTRSVLPMMRKQKFGRIINITSGLADNGAGGFAAYAVSKAGLETLTRTAAEDEEKHNILVNLFNPGPIKTEMHGTGKDPASVTSYLVELAALPKGGKTGRLIEAK
ncbi:SDR family NAD(P)-dependent oxidoreductase [Paenibacillus sp. y28]|uniref:SDR family NAD(P)-dependent oxidoreductase n=1 Tax=Paenibacillus sp. y28 TaxID=3129110 RepID=UPI0030175039